jgi:hypothetical protein
LHLLTDAMHGITNQAAEHLTVANAIVTGITPLIWGAAYNALKDIYDHLPSMSGTQAAAHPGRDPRSPSVGPYAYTPPSAPNITVAPPHVTSNANVDVKVYLDGNILGTSTASDTRVSDSSFDHDGRMGFAGPDVRN